MDQLRKPKILDMSIFDWVTALLGGYLLCIYIFNITDTKLIIMFEFGFIIFGIIVHKIFSVDTMLGYYLGINKKPPR
jgi:lipid-A-disaccharide synthase-like uncharacterized protein